MTLRVNVKEFSSLDEWNGKRYCGRRKFAFADTETVVSFAADSVPPAGQTGSEVRRDPPIILFFVSALAMLRSLGSLLCGGWRASVGAV